MEMKRIPILDMHVNAPIGHIELTEDMWDMIGKIHPAILLGYEWNVLEPDKVLACRLVMQPAEEARA